MKYYAVTFLLLCKRQLKNPIYLLLLLSLPICCFLLHRMEAASQSSIQIGLYCEEPDALTSAVFSDLLEKDQGFAFYVADSEASLKDQVASGLAQCGYQFPPGYQTLFQNNAYKRKIICYTSPSSITESLSKEVVFSALFYHLGKEIALTYVEGSPLFSEFTREAMEITKTQYLYYSQNHGVFSLDYQTMDTQGNLQVSQTKAVSVMPVRGLVGIFMFISGFAGGLSYLKDKQAKLPINGNLTILAPIIFMAASGLAAIAASSSFRGFFPEIRAVLFYSILILTFIRFLLVFVKKTEQLAALIPVFTLGSLIFCPVFINMSLIFPVFRVLEKFFLPFYYLNM